MLLLFLGVTVTSEGFPLLEEGREYTPFTKNYGIYFYSEEGADMDTIFGSYLHFSLKAGVGATYDYFIKEGQQVTGRVESYNEGESERQYVLDRFFEGRDNALLRIVDMPNCDNLKVAVIQYADEKKDSAGTFLQYILTDDEFDTMPQQ
mgnify:FL=1